MPAASHTPTDLLVAAAPGSPGALAVLAALETAGGPRRVLLTGPGLAWARDPALLARLRGHGGAGAGGEVALCSRSARDAGWTAEGTPAGVRWSSVATWLATLDGRAFATLLD